MNFAASSFRNSCMLSPNVCRRKISKPTTNSREIGFSPVTSGVNNGATRDVSRWRKKKRRREFTPCGEFLSGVGWQAAHERGIDHFRFSATLTRICLITFVLESSGPSRLATNGSRFRIATSAAPRLVPQTLAGTGLKSHEGRRLRRSAHYGSVIIRLWASSSSAFRRACTSWVRFPRAGDCIVDRRDVGDGGCKQKDRDQFIAECPCPLKNHFHPFAAVEESECGDDRSRTKKEAAPMMPAPDRHIFVV